MVVVPAETPVTTPLELMVATFVLLDCHGSLDDGDPDPDSVVVALTHTELLPEMVGKGKTVT
jgi:hypothetical protein